MEDSCLLPEKIRSQVLHVGRLVSVELVAEDAEVLGHLGHESQRGYKY